MSGRVDAQTNTSRTSVTRKSLGQPRISVQQQEQQQQQPQPRYENTEKKPQLPVTARGAAKEADDIEKYGELLKKQMAPLKLKIAEESGDKETLIEAVRALQEHEMMKEYFDRAVHRLTQVNKFQEELLIACEQKNRQAIQRLLKYGARVDVSKFCREEVKRAEQLSDKLTIRETPLPKMSTIDRKTMTELRSYSKPSPLVHRIMQAVFLLFDEDEDRTSEWSYCQALCKPEGSHGFLRKIMTFQPDDVNPFILDRVGELLQGIELREIMKASPAAASFYVWLRSFVKPPADNQSVSEQSVTSLSLSPVLARRRQNNAAVDDWNRRKKVIEREKEIFAQTQTTAWRNPATSNTFR